MLTAELLKQQTELSTLPEDAIAKIVSMSKIDEDTVIGGRIAEVYNRLDADIEKASGTKKGTSEKTYEYAQRAITEAKKSGSGNGELEKQIETLKSEKTDLEKQIKSGSVDKAIKDQITTLESKLGDKESELKQWKQKHKDDIAAKESELALSIKDAMGVRIDNQFEKALSGLVFKDEKVIPKDVRDAYIATAKSSLLAELTPEFIDNGNGGKIMVFKKGEEIQRNRDNGLQPFSASELLAQKLAPIIDTGRQASGTGKTPGIPTGSAPANFSLNGAKTQVEAVEHITQHLMGNGIARGNKVSDLPFK